MIYILNEIFGFLRLQYGIILLFYISTKAMYVRTRVLVLNSRVWTSLFYPPFYHTVYHIYDI